MALNSRSGQPLFIGAVMPSQTKIELPNPQAILMATPSNFLTNSNSEGKEKELKLNTYKNYETEIVSMNKNIENMKKNLYSYGQDLLQNTYHRNFAAFVQGEQKKGADGYFAKKEQILSMEDQMNINVNQANHEYKRGEAALKKATDAQVLGQTYYDDRGLRYTLDDKGNVIPEGATGDKKDGYFTVGEWIQYGQSRGLSKDLSVTPWNWGSFYTEGKANEEIDKMIGSAGMKDQLVGYADGTTGVTSTNKDNLDKIQNIVLGQLTPGARKELRDRFNTDYPEPLKDANGNLLKDENGKELTREQQFRYYASEMARVRAGIAEKISITKQQPHDPGLSELAKALRLTKMNEDEIYQNPDWLYTMAAAQGTDNISFNWIDDDGYVRQSEKNAGTSMATTSDRYKEAVNQRYYHINSDGSKTYLKKVGEEFSGGFLDASGTVHKASELANADILGFTGKVIQLPRYKRDQAGQLDQQIYRDHNGNSGYMEMYDVYEAAVKEDTPEWINYQWYREDELGKPAVKNSYHRGVNVFGIDKNYETRFAADQGARHLTDDEYNTRRHQSAYAIKIYVPHNRSNAFETGKANEHNQKLFEHSTNFDPNASNPFYRSMIDESSK